MGDFCMQISRILRIGFFLDFLQEVLESANSFMREEVIS